MTSIEELTKIAQRMIDYVKEEQKQILFEAGADAINFKRLPIWMRNGVSVGARFMGYTTGDVFVLVRMSDGRYLLAEANAIYVADHPEVLSATWLDDDDNPISNEAITKIHCDFQAMFA